MTPKECQRTSARSSYCSRFLLSSSKAVSLLASEPFWPATAEELVADAGSGRWQRWTMSGATESAVVGVPPGPVPAGIAGPEE